MVLETVEDAQFVVDSLVSIINHSYCHNLKCPPCPLKSSSGACIVVTIRRELKELKHKRTDIM